ncbi:MAG: AraC family transcriptional regulator [Paralcaligenes sp.]
MDELSQLMRHLRLQTRVFHRTTHCGRWVVDGEYERKAMFHLVATGRCIMRNDDSIDEVMLQAGDAVLFSRPQGHYVIAPPDTGDEVTTLLLCGYFEFESPLSEILLASLPAQVLLPHDPPPGSGASGAPAALLQLIITEADSAEPGAMVLMDKLSDALFMYALRQCLATGNVERGLLTAISDPHLGPALLAMHQQPQLAWSVASLAARGHLSRAAFARSFVQTVEIPPIEYLTNLRMQLADTALAERGLSVSEASVIAGYATEASFSRAFKRIYGHSPGVARSSQH